MKQKTANFREIVNGYLWSVRGKIFVVVLCMLGFTVSELLAPWPLKIIFDYILLDRPLPPSLSWLSCLLQSGKAFSVFVTSLSIVVIAGLGGLFSYLQYYLISHIGHRLVYTLRRELFSHLQRLSLSYHNRARSGELLIKITGETEAFKDVFVESVLLSISHLTTVVGMFIVMFALNWQLSLVVATTFPFLFLALSYIYRKIKVSTRRQREREGKIAARLGEVLGSVRLVKAFGRESYEQERFDAESELTLEEGIRAERMASAATRAVEFIKAAGLWATVLFGALLVIEGRMSPGDVLIFTAYLNDMFKPLRTLAKVSTRFSRALVSKQRINEIMETEPETWDEESSVEAKGLKGEIVFDHVTFDYGDGKPVLNDVSFIIHPGQRTALVGSSGGGKSTVANLILRFYHAGEGRITIDGVNIEDYRRESLRRAIGTVLQETVLFGVSVKENIAYGKPDATTEEIEIAAQQAHAHEFIMNLPDGYETVLGERGATLSGGQRQRICLARAIIKRPSILILDEPTSAVDAESATLVHEAVERLQREKTTLVIAHHFTDLESFDQILVLRKGRLVEQGTHTELIRLKGNYFRMFRRQHTREDRNALLPQESVIRSV
jgi:ABC-type multidrug transport system fused ATPase/permease subunit